MNEEPEPPYGLTFLRFGATPFSISTRCFSTTIGEGPRLSIRFTTTGDTLRPPPAERCQAPLEYGICIATDHVETYHVAD